MSIFCRSSEKKKQHNWWDVIDVKPNGKKYLFIMKECDSVHLGTLHNVINIKEDSK